LMDKGDRDHDAFTLRHYYASSAVGFGP